MNGAGILPGGCHPDDPFGPKFPHPVDVEVDCRVWDLGAQPDLMERAAKSWREHGDQTSTSAEDIHRSCRELLDSGQLAGDVAQRFDGFATELISKLDQYEGIAERVAEQLDDAAASLRAHQKTLDGLREAILAKVPGRTIRLPDVDEAPEPTRPQVRPGGPDADGFDAPITGCVALPPTHIVFSASSFDDLRVIADAKAEAKQVRCEVDKKNADVHDNLDEIARDLGMMGRELRPGGCSTPECHDRDLPGPGVTAA